MAEQAQGDGAMATAKMPTSVSQVQPLPVGAAIPAVTTDTAEVMMPQQPGKVSSGSAAAPDERKKKKDKDVGGGEGEGGHVYPVKQPLDLKHERCAGVVSKYSPSNGWGSVRSHMFEGEITFRTDRIMLEFQGHPLTEGETVEFDIQADENDHGRPHAVMLKPMIGRKGRDCIGQRHRGYVRRFAERWGFLNAAAFDGDLFVHRDNLLAVPDDGSGQPALRPGQAVEFDVAQDDRGRCVAKQITTHALLRPCDWINHRLRGYIRSFQGAWGFINSDRFAGDLFVHRDSLLAQCAQANLGVGTVVEFDIERDHHRKGAKNRLVARNVAVLPGEAAILGAGQAPIPGQAQQLGGFMPGVDPAAAVYATGAATAAASTPTAGMNPLANTFTPSQTMPMLYPQVGGPTDPYAAAAQLTASAYGAAPYPYAQSPYGLPGMPGAPQPQPQQPLPSPYGQLGQQAYAPTAPYPYGTLPPYGMPPQPGQPQPGLQVPPPLPQQPQPGVPSMPGYPGVPQAQPAQAYMPGQAQPPQQPPPAAPQPPQPQAAPVSQTEGPTQGQLHITMHDWAPDQPGQLYVTKGTLVSVSYRAAHGWVYAGTVQPGDEKGEAASEGWIPQAVVKRVSLCRVQIDWPAEGSGTMDVAKGEIIAVSKEAERGWVYGERVGPRQTDRPADGWLPKKVLDYLQS